MINFRMRKYFVRALLPFLTVWLCFLPSRAYALAPSPGFVLLPGGTAIASGGAAGAAGAVALGAAGAGLLALGMVVGYVAIDVLVGPDTFSYRIPVRDGPVGAIPAPYAPPTSTQVTVWTYGQGTSYYATSIEFCSAAVAFTKASWYGDWPPAWGTVTLGQCQDAGNGQAYQHYTSSVYGERAMNSVPHQGVGCSPGYASNGSGCLLADPRVASPDKLCDIERSGSALAMLSDPDCAAAGDPMSEICSGNFVCQGVDGVGNPQNYVLKPTADGGTDLTTFTQSSNGGTPTVQHETIHIGSDGVVQSANGGTQTGTLPTPGTFTEPTVTNPATGEQVQPVSVEFPSDYARTGEAAQAATQLANDLKPELKKISDPLSQTVNQVDPVEPVAADMPWFGETFSSLLSWQLPAHGSSCPTPSVDLSPVLGPGKVFTMDSHCTLFNDHFAAFQSASMVMWTVLALFVVLKA